MKRAKGLYCFFASSQAVGTKLIRSTKKRRATTPYPCIICFIICSVWKGGHVVRFTPKGAVWPATILVLASCTLQTHYHINHNGRILD